VEALVVIDPSVAVLVTLKVPDGVCSALIG